MGAFALPTSTPPAAVAPATAPSAIAAAALKGARQVYTRAAKGEGRGRSACVPGSAAGGRRPAHDGGSLRSGGGDGGGEGGSHQNGGRRGGGGVVFALHTQPPVADCEDTVDRIACVGALTRYSRRGGRGERVWRPCPTGGARESFARSPGWGAPWRAQPHLSRKLRFPRLRAAAASPRWPADVPAGERPAVVGVAHQPCRIH